MIPYLIELQGIGFLGPKSIYVNPNDTVTLTNEMSVMISPHDGAYVDYDKAVDLAGKLNKKEGHKRWRATARAVAIADFAKYGSKP